MEKCSAKLGTSVQRSCLNAVAVGDLSAFMKSARNEYLRTLTMGQMPDQTPGLPSSCQAAGSSR